jgi:ABC-type multidrug transport system fused ATPase/permease subunit
MNRAVWNLLGRYLPHQTRRFLVLGILSAVGVALEATVLVLTVRAAVAITDETNHVTINVPLVGGQTFNIPGLLWCAVVLGILSAIAALAVAVMTARVSSDVLFGVRKEALRAFSRASWHYQAASREGAVQEAVSNQAMQASELTLSLTRGLSNYVSLFVLLVAALIVDAAITGAVVGLGLLLILLMRPITTATRKRATRFVAQNTRFAESIAEASALALEMRVFGVETEEADRLVDEARSTAHASFLTRFASLAGTALYRNATILFLIGAVGGLYWVGSADIGSVGVVVVLMVRALSYAQQAQWFTQQMNEQAPNLVILDSVIKNFEAAQERFGDVRVNRVGLVSLHDVSYSYGDRPALYDVNLELEPGDLLGVVGPSGGGKSTLVQVLLRLRLPSTGSVLVDGRPYEELAPDDWARLVSVVTQDSHLFAGTVADNIAFHRPGVTREQIVAAAKRAHIASEIERLPGGFDSMLGPRGAGLSGGQRQRLAIARALVGEPNLLVLDEPTSALDVHSERLLQQTIAELEGKVTMVIVAHRLSTIAACRRLLVLDEGEVAAYGDQAAVRRHPFLQRAALGPPQAS